MKLSRGGRAFFFNLIWVPLTLVLVALFAMGDPVEGALQAQRQTVWGVLLFMLAIMAVMNWIILKRRGE